MKDNIKFIRQEPGAVSSGHLRQTMRPTLRSLMAMRVINDNRSEEQSVMKQAGYVAIGLAVTVAVVLIS
jgi:hypothetical protein